MYLKKTFLAAIAVSGLLAGSAQADCPNGTTYTGGVSGSPNVTFGFNAFGIAAPVEQDTFDTGPATSPDCYTTGAITIGTGSAASGVIVTDPGDATQGIYVPAITAVYGQGSSAIGHGATVGRIETYIDDHGTEDPADDTEETRLVPVDNGTALGSGSSVQHNHSTAVGADAKSTKEHQVTLGTGSDTIKAPGITSQKSKNRQNGPLEVVTSDENGNLATDGGAIYGQLDNHSSQLAEHAKGLAIAMAMPNAWLSDKKSFGIFGSVGGFDDETAVGFAAIGRIDETFSLNAKFGSDTEFKQFGWQVGAGAQW